MTPLLFSFYKPHFAYAILSAIGHEISREKLSLTGETCVRAFYISIKVQIN